MILGMEITKVNESLSNAYKIIIVTLFRGG